MRQTVLRTLMAFTAFGWLAACEMPAPPEAEKPKPVVIKPVKKAPVAAAPVKKKPVIDFGGDDDGGFGNSSGSGGGGWN